MRKLILLITLTTFVFSNSSAQSFSNNGYKIEGEIVGLQDTEAILAFYYRESARAVDTALTNKGKFVFSGKKELKKGMYFILIPDKRIEIIISEQKFKFKTSINNHVQDMNFINSKENTIFYNYINFLDSKQKTATPLREKLKTASSSETEKLKQRLESIDKEVKKFQTEILKKNKNLFFSKIINATIEPIIIPDITLDKDGKTNENVRMAYYTNHYWDNIDLTNSGILRTNFFYSKLETFFDKVVFPIPDSIILYADLLIEKSKTDDEVFSYVVSHITSKYERSKIMGMDAVFVNMVEKYYMTKMCTWVDSTTLENIIKKAKELSPNLIGNIAPEFLDFSGSPFMKDQTGRTYTLSSINADHTVIVFYGPTCGHCKKEIPKIKNTLDSLINLKHNIKTFAVCTEFDKEEWGKFIQEQKIGNWINVADIRFDKEGGLVASSDWREKYDIKSTPVIYLLDKEKKIIGKKINHKQVAQIITRK